MVVYLHIDQITTMKNTTVFQFPSEISLPYFLQKWIRCVHRQEWVSNKHRVMCITQFQNEDEISFDKLKDAGGLENILELCYPILKPGAFQLCSRPFL